ncbi:restriction endonuclease subunit S [Gemmiger formicilis]|jgi:type I restriction enzyme S subunit
MARAKKEAALTPEERLQAALVPDWEWPYKLPGNWCWTKITVITDILNGFAFKSQHYSSAGIRIIRITNVQDGFIQDKKPVYYPLESQKEITPFMLKDGDFLMSLTGNVGRVAIIDASFLPAALNQRVACLRIKSEDSVRKEYIFYFCLQKQFVSDCIKSAKGSAQLNMSTEWLKEYPIPLPPLAEQQRIVDRIESLFAKLDEAKEKAQAVVDSFETRKAAILHKAFAGELTAKWREEHGVGMESWEKYKFNELGTLERGRSKHRPRNDPKLFGGKYPFIQTGDVARSGMYITEHTQTLSEVGAEQSKLFPKGTLCITIAANIGDVSILTYDCCFPDSVVGFTPNERTLSEYIYYLMSTLQREIEANAPATAQKNINLRILNDLLLDIPSVAEQTQIVNQVEYLFFQEQHAKEAAEIVLDQIELMKKSILARAFRGELGTNDPSEESAVELLRQVIEQEDGDVIRPKAKVKRIAIPAEIKPLLSGANEEAIVKLLLKAAPQSVSTQTVMSISKKKFELMDALRNLEKKQIVSKSDSGEYSLVR